MECSSQLTSPTRHIVENIISGKLIVSDSQNKHSTCDIYGNPLPQFKNDITGLTSRKLNKNDKFFISNDTPNDRYYLPTIKKFEGYSHFPSPLSPPFNNRTSYIKHDPKLKEKASALYRSHEKNRAMFQIPPNENKSLSYLTSSLNLDVLSLPDKQEMNRLIEQYFKERRDENKYKLNVLDKDPQMKAVKRFRKWMMDNLGDKQINGRRLNSPSKKLKQEYVTVNKCILKKSLEKASKNLEYFLTKESAYQQEEISFLSTLTDNECSIPVVRSADYFQSKFYKEKKFVGGFLEEVEKEQPIHRNAVKNIFKTNGQFYDRDMASLQKGI